MDKVEFFRDRKREWRWRLVSSNGRVIGASSEGYRWRSRCVENFERVSHRPRSTWRGYLMGYAPVVPRAGEFERLVPR